MLKKILKIVLTVFIIILTLSAVYWFLIKKPSPKFSSGLYIDNKSDFTESIEVTEASALALKYMECIEYTISNLNETDKTVTLFVSVPDFSTILDDCIQESISENEDAEYDVILNATQENMIEIFNSDAYPKLEKEMVLEIVYKNGAWKIVPSDEWYTFIGISIIQGGGKR